MAAVPMVRNCMTHTASEGFNRGVGLPGMGSNRMPMYIYIYVCIIICLSVSLYILRAVCLDGC